MLHLPLEPLHFQKQSVGTLQLDMSQEQFIEHLHENIASVPHISGINNHMGSLLTQHTDQMNWLMGEMAKLDELYFIDSKTTSKSVASTVATEHNIPNLVRDVFLDPDSEPETLRKQFDSLIRIAKRRGYAIALAHPHRQTLKFLQENLAELNGHGIELISVSRLINMQENPNHVTCTGTTCTGL